MKIRNDRIGICPIIGVLLGIAAFIMIYGIRVLNPLYTDWLMGNSDLSQHYLGWEFFRNDDWRFPIGMTDKLAYPTETSIIYTDSIPLFAVFFKIFKDILPNRFQYFGIWGIMCFVLQGYFATKIFNKLGMNSLDVIMGDLLIIFSPIVIYRMYMHTSLASQWIILVSLYLVLKHDEDYENIIKTSVYWGIIGFLTVGIHMYFMPMCFLFLIAYTVLSIVMSKKIWKYLVPVISYCMALLFNTWILGGLVTNVSNSSWGLDIFSFNLNGFINNNGYSRFLPNLTFYNSAQMEGFAYLGLGIIILVAISLVLTIAMKIRKRYHQVNTMNIMLIIVGMISIILALSPTVTLGTKVVLEIKLPTFITNLWLVFRSTGRFIWIAWYLVAIYSIYYVSKFNTRFYIGTVLIGMCLIIQLVDISDVIIQKHNLFSEKVEYEYKNADFWEELMQYKDFRQICLCFSDADNNCYIRPAEIALDYGLCLNGFYFARDISDVLQQYSQLERGENPDDDCIYLFLSEQTELMKELENNLRYYYLDDYVVGINWVDDNGKINDFSWQIQ